MYRFDAVLPQAWLAYVVVGPVLVAATVWRRRQRLARLRAVPAGLGVRTPVSV